MTIVNFTPVSALVGGALIGLAAAGMWWLLGRIAGVSSVLGNAIGARGPDLMWRLAFIGGLLVAGIVTATVFPQAVHFDMESGYVSTVFAGLLVGIGTNLGGGCTSGHGVCGVSRLSPRSLVATGAFMASGFLIVFVMRHLL
jgi:uncharacterized membrane protein YedE/YeeE